MKKKIAFASWIAFVAALGLGYGCSSSDDPPSNAPQSFSLDGRTYTEKYTCNQTLAGMPTECVDVAVSDVIVFTSTGGNNYTGEDVPDTGFVYTGTLNGTVLTWSATSPDGYTETGTWTFSATGDSFSGSSHYVATNGTYAGDCFETGVEGTSNVPPDPPFPAECP